MLSDHFTNIAKEFVAQFGLTEKQERFVVQRATEMTASMLIMMFNDKPTMERLGRLDLLEIALSTALRCCSAAGDAGRALRKDA